MTQDSNPWLPVVQRLAREVDVSQYIYDVDQRIVGSIKPGYGWFKHCLCFLLSAGLGAFGLWAASYALGYRLADREQQRLIEAVYRIDPRPERWTDQQLTLRLAIRRDAMDLLEHAAAARSSPDSYPYVAELTGHPPALVDPGRGTALVMLANAVDQLPGDQRGMLVDRIVTVAAALGDPDVQEALRVVSLLDANARRALLANGADGLKRIIEDQRKLEQSKAEEQTLQQQLGHLKNDLQESKTDIGKKVKDTQKWISDLGRIDNQCRHASDELFACLSTARVRSQR